MTNTVFDQSLLPRFQTINPNEIEPSIRQLIDESRSAVKTLLAQPGPYTWDNLLQPLEELNDQFSKTWAPIGHLHAVSQSDALRKAYNTVLPMITDYHTELSQNETLYNAILSIANSPEFNNLNAAQRKIIENELRDFKLAGVHLTAPEKARLAELQQQLSQKMTLFSEHLLDATQAWTLHIDNIQALEGLPEQALQLAKDNAKQRHQDGYVITLDYPSYSTAIKFLRNRDLRKTIYEAYTTRASDVGPHAGQWDNTHIMNDILQIRHDMAQIVGYANYAEYSLATKMAKSHQAVLTFLEDLLARSKPMADAEYQEIVAEAHKDGITDVAAWDLSYYSEKLQIHKFSFTQEDFRPYFPINKVLDGLFNVVNQLYGITIREQPDIETWHPDAKFFAIYDQQQALRGGFYIDLYARSQKRDGAWMDECRIRKLTNNSLQHPVAFLTCNFMPPTQQQPALLTHDDVLTLFHEFGHCLHHMLTKVDYPSVSGINGVPWDAVEFPSQFMENFCWEKASLDLISGHYQTGAPIPQDLYQKLIDAKHFQTGLHMVRQLEFSLFDFKIHLDYTTGHTNWIQSILDQVRTRTAVAPVPAFNRFQHSFAHIFAGSYAAGYYSYKWAEVLSSDAYAQFEENGILDRATGLSFMRHILETGGVRDPMDSFIAFRGRAPTIDALLRQSGIVTTPLT